MSKIILLDGNSLINRAFYAMPVLTNKNGEYTNGVYGFLNILFRFIDEETPDDIGIAFDLPMPTFRHTMFEAYKGTRKGMPEELRPQLPLLKSVLKKMNIAIFEKEGYEADDLLGTIAKAYERQNYDVVVISGDRDLLQIASDKIKIRIPKTKAGKTEVEDYLEKNIIELFGVTPTEYIDVKSLMGDASDNIPGVPSIGEKTAFKIIQEYKTIENAIENAGNIKPKKASENLIIYKEQAILSKILATIMLDVPMELDFDATKTSFELIYNDDAFETFQRLEFKTHLKRFKKLEQINSNASFEFEIVNTESEYKNIIQNLLRMNIVAYKIIFDENKAIGISFSAKETNAVYVTGFEEHFLFENCRPFFESDVKKITLDLKKDLVFLNKFNLDIKNVVFDSMLAGYILNASKDKYEFNDIASEFLNENYQSQDDFFGKNKSKKPLESFELKKLAEYYARQAEVIFRAYPIMNAFLKENNQTELYYNIEHPLLYVLKDMELWGIKADKDALTEYGKNLDIMLNVLTNQIYELAEEEFNINSPKQMGVILFEKLGLKGGKKTKTGYSTAANVLEKLADKHEIISLIMKYRTFAKLKSTYVDGLLNAINTETSKIYSTFNQAITTTGRISSTEPNLQNIPIRLELGRELRKIFVPSDDSYVFVDADYSQIELRVLADMSEDDTFINAFKENQDIHRITASQVFKIPFDKVTPTQRSNAKAVNFGIVYGIGAYSLSQDLNVPVKEAERYIHGYYEKYPKMRVYFDNTISKAREEGYASTIFNRRRSIPELNSSNFIQRSFGERVAMNMPVQGSAADIIKISMINVHQRLKQEGLQSRLILQVHDELLIEMKKEESEKVIVLLKEEMESAVQLKVPLLVDVKVGNNWYEAH